MVAVLRKEYKPCDKTSTNRWKYRIVGNIRGAIYICGLPHTAKFGNHELVIHVPMKLREA